MVANKKIPHTDLLPFKLDDEANDRTRKFLLGVINICLDYVERENKRQEKVIEFYQPDEIMRMFDFSIPDSPTELERLIEDCKQTLAYQVRTGEYCCFDSSVPGALATPAAGRLVAIDCRSSHFAPLHLLPGKCNSRWWRTERCWTAVGSRGASNEQNNDSNTCCRRP